MCDDRKTEHLNRIINSNSKIVEVFEIFSYNIFLSKLRKHPKCNIYVAKLFGNGNQKILLNVLLEK